MNVIGDFQNRYLAHFAYSLGVIGLLVTSAISNYFACSNTAASNNTIVNNLIHDNCLEIVLSIHDGDRDVLQHLHHELELVPFSSNVRNVIIHTANVSHRYSEFLIFNEELNMLWCMNDIRDQPSTCKRLFQAHYINWNPIISQELRINLIAVSNGIASYEFIELLTTIDSIFQTALDGVPATVSTSLRSVNNADWGKYDTFSGLDIKILHHQLLNEEFLKLTDKTMEFCNDCSIFDVVLYDSQTVQHTACVNQLQNLQGSSEVNKNSLLTGLTIASQHIVFVNLSQHLLHYDGQCDDLHADMSCAILRKLMSLSDAPMTLSETDHVGDDAQQSCFTRFEQLHLTVSHDSDNDSHQALLSAPGSSLPLVQWLAIVAPFCVPIAVPVLRGVKKLWTHTRYPRHHIY